MRHVNQRTSAAAIYNLTEKNRELRGELEVLKIKCANLEAHLETQVAELEAAQTLRQMSKAPRDGTEITLLMASRGRWSEKLKAWWWDTPSATPEAWLPCPQTRRGSDE